MVIGASAGPPPPWLALLAPVPSGPVPRRSPAASPEVLATGAGAAIAGWEHLVLELSAGEAGLRVVQLLVNAAGAWLSASDHVLLRLPGGERPWIRQESIGGSFETDGTFRGTCWLIEGPEPRGDEEPQWSMSPRAPADHEVAALRTVLADVLRLEASR